MKGKSNQSRYNFFLKMAHICIKAQHYSINKLDMQLEDVQNPDIAQEQGPLRVAKWRMNLWTNRCMRSEDRAFLLAQGVTAVVASCSHWTLHTVLVPRANGLNRIHSKRRRDVSWPVLIRNWAESIWLI